MGATRDAGDRMSATETTVALTLPPDLVDLVAERAAEILSERQPPDTSPAWLDTAAAEEYAGMKPGRLHDLKQRRKIAPAGWDGRKPMYRREDLDAYLKANQ